MPVKIAPRGVGKPDFSTDVFIQPIPQIRGSINTVPYKKEFENVGPKQTVSFTENLENPHYVYWINVTATANVLIEVVITVGTQDFVFRGWGSVMIKFPASYPFQTLNVKITNLGNITVDKITYNHYGVIGVEKIVPYAYKIEV